MVDKIYRTRENIAYCNSHGIEITGVPLGRPRINEPVDKKKIRQSEIDRIEVERKFSHAKGSYGLGLIRTKLKNTSQTAIALTILALNIALIVRFFRSLFYELLKLVYEPMKWMQNLLKPKNVCFVQ